MPISYPQLVDLAEGRLSPEAAAELRATIAADAEASAELARLEALIGLMRSDDAIDPPSHVLNRALRLFRPKPAPETPSLLRQIIALLQSDSRQQRLATGFRSEQPGIRSLLFSAEDRDLDLQIGPSGQLWQLRGQILGPEEAGSVSLSWPDGQVETTLNELGEFTLPPVPAGRYRLSVRQSDVEILVPDLELGSSPTQT